MSKKEIKKIEKAIQERMEGVMAERDKLDELIGELRDLRDDCENAWDSLERARDALSELV